MLRAVICGMEHSGTTLLSDLIRQSGTINSGFECGVLMAKSPRAFPDLDPFFGFMEDGWKISADALAHCCDTGSFNEFYHRLAHASPLIESTHDVFDKTPRYIARLPEVAARCDAPILTIYKDPRASVYSDYKRAGSPDFDNWLEEYAPNKIRYMQNCYQGYLASKSFGDRTCVLSLEELCFASKATAERVFEHINVPFSIDYLLLNGLRYQNTRAAFVSANIVLEYRTGMDNSQLNQIETRFGEFQDWFFD